MADRSFTIDPRMWITGPFGLCPACGGSEYGTLGISNNRHTRRCRDCWHTATTVLPKLRKKIIYLDQMALSNMAKELDPEWGARTRRRDPFWADLYDQLERLVKLQVIVCPQSPIHEQEASYDDRVEDILRTLCEHLAAGVSFDFPEEIRSYQSWVAQTAYMAGEQPDWTSTEREDVTEGRLDQWMDRTAIRVNMGRLDTPDERRARRDAIGETMKTIWERFRADGLDFDAVFQRELRGIPDAVLESYRQTIQRWLGADAGLPTDPLDLLPGALTRVLLSVTRRFEEAGCEREEARRLAIEFLYSEHALHAPQNRLSAMLFAGLARRAVAGQKRVPNRGTPNDIDMISSYLPYCDAIFVDDEFAELLREEPIATEIAKYGTKVFSTRTREKFMAYLEEIEAGVPAEHRQLVIDTYGESWLTGFRSILELAREREARRKSDS